MLLEQTMGRSPVSQPLTHMVPAEGGQAPEGARWAPLLSQGKVWEESWSLQS